MTTLEQLQSEARVKWGIGVGPNSTQRGQEQVLCDLIAQSFQSGKDAAVDFIEKELEIEPTLSSNADYVLSFNILQEARNAE